METGEKPALNTEEGLRLENQRLREQLERHWDVLRSIAATARRFTPAEACAMVPVLKVRRFMAFGPSRCAIEATATSELRAFALGSYSRASGSKTTITSASRDSEAWHRVGSR